MQADPRHVPHQEVGPLPGDFFAYQGAEVGRIAIVIACQVAVGLANSKPAWRVTILTTRGELCEVLVHEETRGHTWQSVQINDSTG